ncbi:hypothetical protein ALC53_12165 [Atta colombica]|uniref:Uncharacterized protein n=1 Tax=Atta colombica TaxID=520822 RepID=A0A151HZD8_9HYME|nr:hypothetical protein ALC53_12165 [Atta colombica]
MSRISCVRGASRAIPRCNASAMTVDVNGQKITVPIYHVCVIVTQVFLAGLTLSLDIPSRFHERYRCKVIRVKSNEARRGMQTGGEGKHGATWEKLRPNRNIVKIRA